MKFLFTFAASLFFCGMIKAQNGLYDHNQVIASADVILIGELEAVPMSTIEMLDTDLRYFIIKPTSYLKGKLKDHARLQMDVRSSVCKDGLPANIESGRTYMLFLVQERADGVFPDFFKRWLEGAFDHIHYPVDHKVPAVDKKPAIAEKTPDSPSSRYQLVGNWKGIVPFDPGATENRVFKLTAQYYGFDLLQSMDGFKEAIAYVTSAKKEADISDQAKKVITALSLIKLPQ